MTGASSYLPPPTPPAPFSTGSLILDIKPCQSVRLGCTAEETEVRSLLVMRAHLTHCHLTILQYSFWPPVHTSYIFWCGFTAEVQHTVLTWRPFSPHYVTLRMGSPKCWDASHINIQEPDKLLLIHWLPTANGPYLKGKNNIFVNSRSNTSYLTLPLPNYTFLASYSTFIEHLERSITTFELSHPDCNVRGKKWLTYEYGLWMLCRHFLFSLIIFFADVLNHISDQYRATGGGEFDVKHDLKKQQMTLIYI